MPAVLVTGSNRGIGLEFCRQYAAEGWRVFAATRRPEKAEALKALKGDVRIHALDVADDRQIEALAATLQDEPLDILINNAGVIGPDDRFGHTPAEPWLDTFRVNTVAPVHMVERFLPHLERGRERKVLSLTSGMGSIADNTSGGSYAYRTSKAALNMATRSMAIDLAPRGIILVVMNPGWVKTDMGGPGARMTPEQSVAAMRRKLAALTPEDSGRFFNHTGEVYPW